MSNLIGLDTQHSPSSILSASTATELKEMIDLLPEITDKVILFEGCSLRFRTGDWALSPSAYQELERYFKSLKLV